MKTTEICVCPDCVRDRLAPAMLVYKKVPNTEDMDKCEFCKKRRLCSRYLVQYGRDKR